jgi:hypothetical protein
MTNTIDRADLVDISSVQVDKNQSKHKRIIEFVRLIGDPYHYICNEFEITSKFTEGGPAFEDCLRRIAT